MEYRNITYQPIEIDADSPSTLIFRLPPVITYTGQVVDGVTGKPIAGALVLGWSGTRQHEDNFAMLTDAQWDALHDLPTESVADHPALGPVKKGFTIQQATRTDADGRYALVQPIDETFWGLMAVDQDRLPIYESVLKRFKPDDQHHAHIKPIPLFPAATVVVNPQVGKERISVGYSWTYGAVQDEPEWVGTMRQLNRGMKRGFQRMSWLKRNEAQPILVPAGVPLKLRFRTPYADDWSDFAYDKLVELEQGETLKLDQVVTFERSAQYTVRVLDPQGNPVEGIPVRRLYHRNRTGSVSHNTDAQGLARLYVDPDETGQFFVSMKDAPVLDFDSSQDEHDKVFVLRLTDDQIKRALGRD